MNQRAIVCGRLLSLSLILLVPACGGGGGGGGPAKGTQTPGMELEPNGTSVFADALLSGVGQGSLASAGDVDYWALPLVAGDVIEIDLFATRVDQAAWNAATNVPAMVLYGTDGTTKLQEHAFSPGTFAPAWTHGRHDFGFPCFRVRTTGTHYVAVRQDNPAAAGGAYVLRTRSIAASLRLPVQLEVEARGATGGNDTAGTAETILPGTVLGHYAGTATPDLYRISLTSGEAIIAELTAHRNGVADGGTGYFNPLLRLYATDGTTLLKTNDNAHFSDPVLEYRVSSTGLFYLEVFSSSGGNADYALDVRVLDVTAPVGETESNDTIGAANGPAGGSFSGAITAGETDTFVLVAGVAGDLLILHVFDSSSWAGATNPVTVQFLDNTGAPLSSVSSSSPRTVQIARMAATNYFAQLSAAVPTDYAIHLEKLVTATAEVEPNDTAGTAMPIAGATPILGLISDVAPTELDFYSFTAAAGELVSIACSARMDGGFTGSNAYPSRSFQHQLQPLLRIRDGVGAILATSTATPTNGVFTDSTMDGAVTCGIAFRAPAAGTYTVDVSDVRGAVGPVTLRSYTLQKR